MSNLHIAKEVLKVLLQGKSTEMIQKRGKKSIYFLVGSKEYAMSRLYVIFSQLYFFNFFFLTVY